MVYYRLRVPRVEAVPISPVGDMAMTATCREREGKENGCQWELITMTTMITTINDAYRKPTMHTTRLMFCAAVIIVVVYHLYQPSNSLTTCLRQSDSQSMGRSR